EQRLLQTLPLDMQADYHNLLTQNQDDTAKIIKAADRLCAYIKCVEELKAGNREFESAAETTLAKLAEMDCPEASVFLEEFAPAFGLTIDEIAL
ncbi:MAG: HD domain-containing protein, partial [Clostridia bacterium]|nr:HD domain-containing protein [Clostridia bacterium]